MLVFTLIVIATHVAEERACRPAGGQAGLRWDAARRGAGRAIGGVWLHQGLGAKVLGHRPEQTAIIAAVPWLGWRHARRATVALGWAETALAAWVVSWRAPRTAAAVQTLLIVSMPAGGWWFAPARLAHPRRLLVRNAGLLALIWVAATAGDGR
jgi:hypothetical protein